MGWQRRAGSGKYGSWQRPIWQIIMVAKTGGDDGLVETAPENTETRLLAETALDQENSIMDFQRLMTANNM